MSNWQSPFVPNDLQIEDENMSPYHPQLVQTRPNYLSLHPLFPEYLFPNYLHPNYQSHNPLSANYLPPNDLSANGQAPNDESGNWQSLNYQAPNYRSPYPVEPLLSPTVEPSAAVNTQLDSANQVTPARGRGRPRGSKPRGVTKTRGRGSGLPRVSRTVLQREVESRQAEAEKKEEKEEQNEYEVEEIMDSKRVGGSVRYLVKWQGWEDKKDWTWEPYKNFFTDGARDVVLRFHKQNPDKPADPKAVQG
ncbi:hypothetical protein F4825DRAFT_472467 [Nemania diffusa]|nr:hypothetical protein F4825DRAFT_472467 [Nemania diffusa]